MPAQLVCMNDGPSILLDKPILLIGRHPECDIQIDSRKVSRRHCCIAQVNDYLVVRDLGSTNGVRINGVRVLEGKLNASDELTIGGTRFRVTWDMLPDMPVVAPPSGPPVKQKQPDSCDEPVPLAEPDGPVVAIPVALPLAGAPHQQKPVIPEGLKLASSSDLDIGPNPHIN